MERDFINDEFELFLKQKADQHKLYPSDKAWKGIYNSLHPGMRWFKIGSSILMLSTLFFIYQETNLFKSSSSLQNNPIPVPASAITQSARSTNNFNSSIAPFTTLPGSKPITSGAVAEEPRNLQLSQSVDNVVAPVKTLSNESIGQLNGFILQQNQVLEQSFAINVKIPRSIVTSDSKEEKNEIEIVTNKELNGSAVTADIIKAEDAEKNMGDYNWLQEMAAVKLAPRRKSPFNVQFYFSPTVSYRRLSDNQNNSHSSALSVPITATRDLNINKYVDQTPSIGAELGSNILFSPSRNLTFKSGLQLNYSRYNIKAYKFYYEKASIALTSSGPVGDTISSYTSYRNFNGYSPENLQNQYLQVSVPIGVEFKLLGDKRLQFNVAGSIQPTFLLFSDTYLLSTNYLNYTKEPSLVRKWNMHSGFEAYLSYQISSGLRWQLGPQFRYQLMSSYNDRYPIKEYLFEYGVKIGISKMLR